MLLINGIYYNPAFITHIEKESNGIEYPWEKRVEWFCVYFSVPVKRSIQCTSLAGLNINNTQDDNREWFIPHIFPDVKPDDVWVLKVEDAEDIARIEKYLASFE